MSNEETQSLMIEVCLEIKTPKMSVFKLTKGIKRIITKQWPDCMVDLEDVQIISVADMSLAHEDEEEV